MNKIIVFGACGLAGAKISYLLSANNSIISVCDKHESPWGRVDLTNINDAIHFVNEHRPSAIIYAAGLTDVDQCEQKKNLASLLNHRAPKMISQLANSKFIFISTDYVFDGVHGGYSEFDIPNPINYYGRTKLEGEREVMKASRNNAVIRVSGLYGINQTGSNKWLKSLQLPIIEVEDNRFSCPTFIDDVATSIEQIIKLNMSGIFHLTGPNRMSRYDFIMRAVTVLNIPNKVVLVHRDAGKNIALRPIDTSLIHKRLCSCDINMRSVDECLLELHNQLITNQFPLDIRNRTFND